MNEFIESIEISSMPEKGRYEASIILQNDGESLPQRFAGDGSSINDALMNMMFEIKKEFDTLNRVPKDMLTEQALCRLKAIRRFMDFEDEH